jgi:hypothetical protein
MDREVLSGLGLIGAMNIRQVNAETINILVSSLNFLQIVVLTLRGSVLIDWVRFEGWKGKLPLYIIKCPYHGYQLTYPSGFGTILKCPKCISSE